MARGCLASSSTLRGTECTGPLLQGWCCLSMHLQGRVAALQSQVGNRSQRCRKVAPWWLRRGSRSQQGRRRHSWQTLGPGCQRRWRPEIRVGRGWATRHPRLHRAGGFRVAARGCPAARWRAGYPTGSSEPRTAGVGHSQRQTRLAPGRHSCRSLHSRCPGCRAASCRLGSKRRSPCTRAP